MTSPQPSERPLRCAAHTKAQSRTRGALGRKNDATGCSRKSLSADSRPAPTPLFDDDAVGVVASYAVPRGDSVVLLSCGCGDVGRDDEVVCCVVNGAGCGDVGRLPPRRFLTPPPAAFPPPPAPGTKFRRVRAVSNPSLACAANGATNVSFGGHALTPTSALGEMFGRGGLGLLLKVVGDDGVDVSTAGASPGRLVYPTLMLLNDSSTGWSMTASCHPAPGAGRADAGGEGGHGSRGVVSSCSSATTAAAAAAAAATAAADPGRALSAAAAVVDACLPCSLSLPFSSTGRSGVSYPDRDGVEESPEPLSTHSAAFLVCLTATDPPSAA